MKVPDLFKEYIWLVNTIWKARKISFADIQDRWIETEMSEGVELARSTFNRHKDAIEDIFGVIIDCDRLDGYRYYISNAEVLRENTIQNWMLSTMSVSNIISESMSVQDRILLESIPSEGAFLQTVINAMKKDVKLSISYQRYESNEIRQHIIEPYCIKLFKRRWYILAHYHYYKDTLLEDGTSKKELHDFFGILSFDRIHDIQPTSEKFEMDPDFDAEVFFSDSFGIVIGDDTPTQRIVLRAYGAERFYLRDLPLHPSQREIGQGVDYADFEVILRPTLDLSAHILSRSSQVKVLSPTWLAEEVCQMHEDAIERYADKK